VPERLDGGVGARADQHAFDAERERGGKPAPVGDAAGHHHQPRSPL